MIPIYYKTTSGLCWMSSQHRLCQHKMDRELASVGRSWYWVGGLPSNTKEGRRYGKNDVCRHMNVACCISMLHIVFIKLTQVFLKTPALEKFGKSYRVLKLAITHWVLSYSCSAYISRMQVEHGGAKLTDTEPWSLFVLFCNCPECYVFIHSIQLLFRCQSLLMKFKHNWVVNYQIQF